MSAEKRRNSCTNNKYRYIIAAVVVSLSLVVGITLGALAWLIEDTPNISDYRGGVQTSRIYSSDGELLNSLFVENRLYVELDDIPEELTQAVIAIEDHNFYDHHGVDLVGIGRALLNNLREGRLAEGGSTITQQLARSALLTHDKTIYRKLQEIYLAMQFERLYTKSEILEMYMNEIFLGHNAYGVQAASQLYFDKDVSELSLEESALLAGLPRSPNFYSPHNNQEAALRRRNVVLNRMAEIGFLSEEEARQAAEEEIDIASREEEEVDETAPYFVRHVRDQLIRMFGADTVYGGGLEVKTTLNVEQQETAEDTIEGALEDNLIPSTTRDNTISETQPQYSLVSIEPETGEILTMIGGRGDDQFNRATQATRQPGSAFKPFVYATAIQNGFSPGDIVHDIPRPSPKDDSTYEIWPVNFDHEYHGLVSLRHALAQSLNVAAVNMIEEVGLEDTTELTEEMGITTLQEQDYYDDHLSLALGGLTRGVTPLEMTSAYSVFANDGIWVEPHAIKEVRDREGNVIYRANPERKAVMSESDNYLALDMLRSVVEDGTGWRADLERDVAGKTGTTNDFTDAWFVGMIPEKVTTVWMGEDRPRRMNYPETGRIGSSQTVMIWERYMDEIIEDIPETSFERPEDIISLDIDPATGLQPGNNSIQTTSEIFRIDNTPDQTSDFGGNVETVRLDGETGDLATTGCPQERIEEAEYITESGVLLGPQTKNFGQTNPSGDHEPISGTYIAQDYMPVLDIDPETGIPRRNDDGEPEFASVPQTACEDHVGFALDEPEIGDDEITAESAPAAEGDSLVDLDDVDSDEEASPAEDEEAETDGLFGFQDESDDVEDETEVEAEDADSEEEDPDQERQDRRDRIDSLLDLLTSDEAEEDEEN